MKIKAEGSADIFVEGISAFFKYRRLTIVIVAGLIFASTMAIPTSAFACGLEPMVQGGLGGGYPGALKVAVACSRFFGTHRRLYDGSSA